jgi:serine/threonine-protein kinase Chk2
VFLQIVKGVKYLHDLGIVHRDLKLENIMMSSDDENAIPKIVDFGLSYVLGPGETLTEPIGTVNYCAPEIIKSTPYSY